MTRLWGGGGAYEAWADHLERWGRGERLDASRLPPLAPGDFSTGTWERFSARLTEAFDRRLQAWADTLTAALRAEGGDEFAFGRALAQAREGLRSARELTRLPALPPGLGSRLDALLAEQVTRVQRELEEDARRDAETAGAPASAEARLRPLRDNPLTAALAGDGGPGERADGPGWSYDPASPSRRRVIGP
ncbi:hypothetical protein RM780_20150 [Streptomyces sp. DSM 44917]|uniref:Poly(3-hydroxyalkanoate) polymerase subunit PhaE n=1 Tax=Streptomyces boetiae TaxID=3075541 RepID=A0ABU2LCE5_9ACTN|nr:hypothetical protein [Streptomyces sp. DSM 44917]MDT0309256.1 hypothetical protein [Streptomyces sp. DSM 44917]